MSRQINQPINQVRLTNVAVVRHNVKGMRFEIACYRNKILDYRAGLETDLSEVLQTDRVFTNVSKGRFAAAADIKKAFKTTDQEAVAQIILDQGKQLQVSDLERQQLLDQTLTQISVWISKNCVHSQTNRPFPASQIQSALTNFSVQPHKALKRQYLDAVKFLKENDVLPIQRARMELSLEYEISEEAVVREALDSLEMVDYRELQSTSGDGTTKTVAFQVDPSSYRSLNDLTQRLSGSRLEILQQQVVNTQDSGFGSHLESQVSSQTMSTTTANDYTYDEEAQQLQGRLEELGIRKTEIVIEEKKEEEKEEESHSRVEDDEDEYMMYAGANQRKNQRKAQKKKKKKNKRLQRQEQQEQNEEDATPQTCLPVPPVTVPRAQQQSANAVGDATKSCNTCGGSFANSAEYRAHFRSDWHRFNQKLKVKGLQPVSEDEFLLCDADAFFS